MDNDVILIVATIYWIIGALYSYTWVRHLPSMRTGPLQQAVLIINSMVGWPFLFTAEFFLGDAMVDEHLEDVYGQGFHDAMEQQSDQMGGHVLELGPEEATRFFQAMQGVGGFDGLPAPAGFVPINTYTIWLTGLSGAGKSTVAKELQKALAVKGCASTILDGDVVREGLCNNLGFSQDDRKENIRRVAEAAKLLNSVDETVIVACISPYESDRKMAADIVGDKILQVFVDTPLKVCEDRDVKGLYAKARSGEIKDFTGVDDPYEKPSSPDVHLLCNDCKPDAAAESIVRKLEEKSLTSSEEPSE